MGMERKVEGCHIDGVISWSAAVRLSPSAALPPQETGERISTTTDIPTGAIELSSPQETAKNFQSRQ
jgi:hypothetical protein